MPSSFIVGVQWPEMSIAGPDGASAAAGPGSCGCWPCATMLAPAAMHAPRKALRLLMYRPQRAVHGVGCQPVASTFLKCGLVQYGVVRFSGSTISVVTTSNDSPPGTSSRSKYSVITVFALYGTPFLRRYPGFMLVVTTFSEPPRSCGAPRFGI